jgi:hypothetical protein
VEKLNWLAFIAAPYSEGMYNLSTGVPISRKHVLTTAHGIPADSQTDIKVRFVHDFNARRDWRTAHTVWHSLEYDAALLETAEVKELRPFIYSSNLPDSTTPWEGAGFAQAGKINQGELAGERNSIGLHGNFYPGGNLINGDLELTVEAPPEVEGKWKGISGAPVIIGERLIGIIKTLKGEFNGNRLCGVPLAKMLNDKKFRMILGIDKRKEQLDFVKKKAGEILKNCDEAILLFCDQPLMNGCAKDASTIIDILVDMKIDFFLKVIYSVHCSAGDDKIKTIIERLISLLLPHIYDPDCIESVKIGIKQGVLFSLPAATRTITEIIMAGVDCRPTDFCRPVMGDNFPVGTPLIEMTPEGGFDFNDENKAIKAFDEHMSLKFVSEEDRKKEKTLQRKLVNDELEYLSTKDNDHFYRHYFIYNQPAGDDDYTRRTIERLRNDYPKLYFITLNSSDNLLLANRRIDRWIRDICKSVKGK